MLFPPLVHLDALDLATANRCLVTWQHKMGPFLRPQFGRPMVHALFAGGDPVSVVIADALIRETCAGLTRSEAFEVARVCAVRPDLCRAMIRLWREFVFPRICDVHGWRWALSYQDAIQHSGNLYRFDGWERLGKARGGSTDPRSGRKSAPKVIWGWRDRRPNAATAGGAA